ncbi:MAG: adenosylmethionine decarboxylase [Candidatus Lokiarchaeota archaeon]|nr:adenosylmethionine decarboxylase [Candidatus Lokiarchaeota archaeon]
MNLYFVLKQFIGDYWNCDLDWEKMNSGNFLQQHIIKAVELSLSSIVKWLDYNFSPQGYTYLAVLSNSSIILHTWPEESFISVEIFTCTEESNPEAGLRYLAEIFKPKLFKIHHVKRDEMES